jgi:hypothetical protein
MVRFAHHLDADNLRSRIEPVQVNHFMLAGESNAELLNRRANLVHEAVNGPFLGFIWSCSVSVAAGQLTVLVQLTPEERYTVS